MLQFIDTHKEKASCSKCEKAENQSSKRLLEGE